jgi:hypothetical protein
MSLSAQHASLQMTFLAWFKSMCLVRGKWVGKLNRLATLDSITVNFFVGAIRETAEHPASVS